MVADILAVRTGARFVPPFRALFFSLLLFAFFSTASALAELSPERRATWSHLLHIHNDRPLIEDPGFLLTESEVSVAQLRQLSIDLFVSDPASRCRFPARYITLVSEGAIERSGLEECTEYQEFVRRVPVDAISVIFASEHLTQPSSIMGHVMLAMSGDNTKGQYVEHAASFFTTLDFANPASFIAQTLITGKEGYFIVQPLSASLNNYLYTEQRNVWRYPLELTARQRELMQAHMWELGGTDIPYLFQSHNCATLSLDLVRLAVNDPDTRRDWVSPIDVVRYADRHKLFNEKRVLASDRWQVSMLQEFMTVEDVDLVDAWLSDDRPDTEAQPQTAMNRRLAQVLARYRVTQGQMPSEQYQRLSGTFSEWESTQLELTDYRDPLKSAADAHISLGYQHDGGSDWITFGWLPAAHDLMDNNRNYFGESILRLSDVRLRASTDNGRVQLEGWTLYETLALNPWNRLTGGVSGYFHMRLDRDPLDSLKSDLGFATEGGVGVTIKPARDIGVFALVGAGMRAETDNLHAFLHPQVGMWIYEVANMKSWLRAGARPSTSGDSLAYASFDHSIEVLSTGLLTFTAERAFLDDETRNQLDAGFRYYF